MKMNYKLALVVSAAFATSANAAVTFVGAITDDAGSEISAWRTAGTSKSLDLDGDNVYGTAGYAAFNNGFVGSGTPQDVTLGDSGNTVQSDPSFATLSLVGTPRVANYFSASDFDNPNGGSMDGGYSGISSGSRGALSALADTYVYTIDSDFGGTIRIGIFADSLADTALNMTALEIRMNGAANTAGTAAAIVGNNNNGSFDGYFFDITGGVTAGDTITIRAAGGTVRTSGPDFNLPSISALTIEAVPEPSSTALLGLGGLALILRRRKG